MTTVTATSPTDNSQMLPLSVFIIACNEAQRIGQVIDSVKSLAAEIVVVDSGSTDDTCEIARQKGARLIHHEWPGYGAQKRFAEDQCTQDWLLNLDADEVIGPALANEIRALFANGLPAKPCYQIRVVTVYPHHDRPRWLADYNSVIRLYDRNVVRFPDHPTWDAIEPPPDMKVTTLEHDCWHYSLLSLAFYVAKFNDYTTLQAGSQKLKSHSGLLMNLVFGFPLDFLRTYFLKRHFTGGSYGFVFSVSRAYARFLKNAKMLEIHLNRHRRRGN